MSIPALTWADLQETGRPGWQSMIYVLAHNADQELVAFRWWKSKDHWWPYLIKHTGLTRSSIFRVLKDMERVGLIHREIEDGKLIITIHADRVVRANEAGELESYHRTGETLELIASEPAEKGESEQEVESDDKTRQMPSPIIGPNESDDRTRSNMMNQILESDSPTQTLPRPEQPPASEASPAMGASGEASIPQSQPGPAESADSPEKEKLWVQFCSDYPKGIVNHRRTREAFMKLDLERARACRAGAAAYAVECAAAGKRHIPIKAHLFIEQEGWKGMKAKAGAQKASTPASNVFIRLGTPEATAIKNLYRMTPEGSRFTSRAEGRECYVLPTAPCPQVMAMAQVPPESRWEFFDLGTANHLRWREFVFKHTGKGLALSHRGSRPGFLAPHPWPPRIDGTWSESPELSATGPPTAPTIPELTEDDVDALTDRLTG